MHRLTFILGCTGCGKGTLGRLLAERMGGEVLSVDSMKVYRGMDLGTAKPSKEDRARVPHHLIDRVDPWEEYSVAQFVAQADQAVADAAGRGRPVFAVGGTALYIKALAEGLFEGPSASPALRTRLKEEAKEAGLAALHARLVRLDPAAAGRIHPNDARRIIRALEVFELSGRPISALQRQWDRERTRYECLFIGLRREIEDQNRRINARVRWMMEKGLLEETRSLLALPRPLSATARRALGYAELIEHLEGRLGLENAVEEIKIKTRRFAKSQRTWFRRFRRVHWVDLPPDAEAEVVAEDLVDRFGAFWERSDG